MELLVLTVPEAEPGQLARVELDAPPAGAEDPGPEPVPPRREPSGPPWPGRT